MVEFRLGLIGAGRMGRTHLRALSGSAAVRVVAVAEPSDPVRAAVAQDGIAIHADVDAMLRVGGLDGVLVAAPSTLHLDLVARIADAGLPILCEKPCGISAQQARQAASLAERRNVRVQVAYWRRFVPALQRLRRRIADGEMGAPYFLACYQWDGEPPSMRFQSDSGGIFIDMGVHEFDQIRWLSGQEFRSIAPAVAAVSAGPLAAGDAESAQALCTLSGGSTALVSLGRRFPLGDVCRVEVFGAHDAEECRFLWPPDGELVFMQALRRQAESFAAWVRGGAAEGATADDAVAALQAAERASVALGQ
ncbi:MAG: Gfo/Idh/MocA family oxidoreductase [Acetobacteraceae bacterium]|jgi:myo-inositol 2-dehydrogenase/D-chiro-inositol 1-dehydrogenase